MKFLLDQGLPRDAVVGLAAIGHDALHVADIGMSASSDVQILSTARSQARVIVTLDADFHALMATGNHAAPSVIRIRIEGLKADAIVQIVIHALSEFGTELESGVLLTIDERSMRAHSLPIS